MILKKRFTNTYMNESRHAQVPAPFVSEKRKVQRVKVKPH